MQNIASVLGHSNSREFNTGSWFCSLFRSTINKPPDLAPFPKGVGYTEISEHLNEQGNTLESDSCISGLKFNRLSCSSGYIRAFQSSEALLYSKAKTETLAQARPVISFLISLTFLLKSKEEKKKKLSKWIMLVTFKAGSCSTKKLSQTPTIFRGLVWATKLYFISLSWN